MMGLPIALKRAIRPLVPDRVMAALRLREHSRQVRTNVDLVVDDWWEQRRWLAVTPDTYRVRARRTFGAAPPHVVVADGTALRTLRSSTEVIVMNSGAAPDELGDLVRVLSDTELIAAVSGPVTPPRLAGRRRVEPGVVPSAIAVRPEVVDHLGNGADVVTVERLHALVRDLGGPLGVVPTGTTRSAPQRSEPIPGDHVAVVLALVPMHDIGGGSRGSQLAVELLRQGWYVVYTALYGTAESLDLGLRFVHPRLEQHRASDVDLSALVARVSGRQRLAVVEAPVEAYVVGASVLQAGGFTVVYDLIDDWSIPSLGGDWYRTELEARLGGEADTLVASAPDLVRHLEALSGRPVTLVPNAVNAAVFTGEAVTVPDDLPDLGTPVIGYHGSLYGDWFDWQALADVAAAHPHGTVVVIGDEPDAHPAMPGNVHFLGLKPQTALPGYLARLDVGLVPFRVSDATHAVSPLKAYEYLAMGVPVAAPPLRALAGLDGVHRDPDLVAATSSALRAGRVDGATARRQHSWQARVAALCEAAGLAAPDVAATAPRQLLRPAAHHRGRDRSVRASP